MKTPTQEKITSLINELVICLLSEADAKDSFKSIIELVKEDYEDFDTAILSAAAKKQFKKVYNPEAFEKERLKAEAVYEIVDSIGD